jgi:pyruvate,water dikinase
LERQAVEREVKTQEVRARMGFARRPLFRRFLADAQAQVAHRERTKSIVVRAARMSDHILAEVARRAAAAGVVERPDDIFFLTYAEVLDFLRGADLRCQASVTRRRREFERNRHIELPERFRGRPAPLPEMAANDAESLSGTGVSAGAVTGRARVIRDPAVDGSLEPGEILVAPVTDAGWTPLFGLASGIVVDIGSALSHGSTVAREYGLPAVVNVKHGTRLIRTGDLVRVDGAAGRVTIVERASPPLR